VFYKNKSFQKQVYLVVFIIGIYYDAWTYERQIAQLHIFQNSLMKIIEFQFLRFQYFLCEVLHSQNNNFSLPTILYSKNLPPKSSIAFPASLTNFFVLVLKARLVLCDFFGVIFL
jgi:hypothetical protein